jgi:serine/threonine protein kinase/formylglycine-generating enzyme required for sulfatase activity
MTTDDTLASLLDDWHQSAELGRELPAATLCADHPELIPELARQIEAVRRVSRLVLPESPNAGTPAQQVSPDGPTLTQQWQIDSAVPTGDTPVGLASTPVVGGAGSIDLSGAPRRLGGYRLLKLLGSGGMGEVYLAEDAVLTRQVALKVMKPEVAVRPEFRERFLREARSAAGLQHDHIVPIYHVGDDAGMPYIAMPLLQGESLEDRLRREARFPVAEVVRIGREAAQGLAAAHAAGLVHRDIKPANLWLEAPDGRVKVLDFGLARAATPDGLTQAGIILGTPQYMAPEQIDGLPVDGRTDLFSLGCVLFRLATGELPFQGATLTAVLRAVAEHHPLPPCVVRRDVPVALSNLIIRLLAKDPGQRPASAREVVDVLRTFDAAKDLATAATPATVPQPTAAPRRRRWSWTFKISLTITISFALMFAVGLYLQVPTMRDTARHGPEVAILSNPPPPLPEDLNARNGTGAVPTVGASKAPKAPPAAGNLGTEVSSRAATNTVPPTVGSIPMFADPPQDPLSQEVEKLLTAHDFRGAAERLRAAESQGGNAAWVAAQHQRVRDAWRQAVVGRPSDEARLIEYEALLKEYPADAEAKALVSTLRNRFVLREQMGRDVDRRLAQNDFHGAAAQVRTAAAGGADTAGAQAQHERIAAAWRQRAAAKATDEERLSELEALLKEYPGDTSAQAAVSALRTKIVASPALDLGSNVTMKLVEIKPPAGGTFPMGSPADEPERAHDETFQYIPLARAYLLGETEVTVAQFRRFVEDTRYVPKGLSHTPPLDWANPFPQAKQTDDHPVVGVTWSDAVAFCNWLSQKTGRKCRLPYEAEWEYACRAGTTTPYSFGPKLSKDRAAFNSATPDPEAKLLDGSGSPAPTSTVPVRKYPPNAWGLYGMHGNAAEWCVDAYQRVSQPPGQSPLAKDAGDGVARGGGWKSTVEECRSAFRWKRTNNAVPKDDIGFRICVER